MISLNIQEAKAGFLDRKAVQRAIGQANAGALMRVSAQVRTFARRSMRRAGKGNRTPSAPGTPPKARSGQLRDLLFFALDNDNATVVIGPAALGARPVIPGLHEFGGSATVRGARRTRKLGDGGEVRIVSGAAASQKRGGNGQFLRQSQRGKPVAGRPGVNVVYAKLRTPAQVDRANRINAELYPDVQATYPARPYMAPALAKNVGRIPDAWKNSVRAS